MEEKWERMHNHIHVSALTPLLPLHTKTGWQPGVQQNTVPFPSASIWVFDVGQPRYNFHCSVSTKSNLDKHSYTASKRQLISLGRKANCLPQSQTDATMKLPQWENEMWENQVYANYWTQHISDTGRTIHWVHSNLLTPGHKMLVMLVLTYSKISHWHCQYQQAWWMH